MPTTCPYHYLTHLKCNNDNCAIRKAYPGEIEIMEQQYFFLLKEIYEKNIPQRSQMNSILRDKFLQHAPNSMLALVESLKEMNECKINVKDIPKRSKLAIDLLSSTNTPLSNSNTGITTTIINTNLKSGHCSTCPKTNVKQQLNTTCCSNGQGVITGWNTSNSSPTSNCYNSLFGNTMFTKFSIQKKNPKPSNQSTNTNNHTKLTGCDRVPSAHSVNNSSTCHSPTRNFPILSGMVQTCSIPLVPEQSNKRKFYYSNVNGQQQERTSVSYQTEHQISSPTWSNNSTLEYNHDSKKRKVDSFHISTEYSSTTTSHCNTIVTSPLSNQSSPNHSPNSPITPTTPSFHHTFTILPPSPCKLPPIRDLLNSLF